MRLFYVGSSRFHVLQIHIVALLIGGQYLSLSDDVIVLLACTLTQPSISLLGRDEGVSCGSVLCLV